jgi:hypothetical protein
MCAADTRGVRRRAARLALSALAVVTAGCAVSPRDHAPFFQALPVENRPVTAPVRSISSFSDSLACMDKMLGDYGKGTTLITSKIIPDASGKISVATKDMAITALSQMSRTSNAFRYVDYEVEALKQDTVQNLTTLLLNAGQMHLVKPALYISGAISYLDQNVMINRLGLGIAAERWEAGCTWGISIRARCFPASTRPTRSSSPTPRVHSMPVGASARPACSSTSRRRCRRAPGRRCARSSNSA